ncbi:MAG: hypothetical protein KDD55_06320 [Bdellovibrionales bacterium]|nr:hypothetical protein [Bdellovibrionales bacterium]
MKGFHFLAVMLGISLCVFTSNSFAEEIEFTLLATRSCDGTSQAPYIISESQEFMLPENVLRYITFTKVRTGGVASVMNPTEDLIPYNFFSHFWVTTWLDIPGYWSHTLTTVSDSVHETGWIPMGAERSMDIEFEQTKRSLFIDAPVCAPAQPLTIGVMGECFANESGESDLFVNRWMEVTVRFVYRPLPDGDTSCD